LHNACASSEKNGDIVKYLIEKGSNVNARNDDGNTPLIWASVNGNIEAVNVLIESRADMNLKDYKQMRTALHDAVRKEQIEVVKLLLEKGAKLDVTDKKGKAPHEMIVSNSSSLINIFKPYIEDKNRKRVETKVPKTKRKRSSDSDSDDDFMNIKKSSNHGSKGNSNIKMELNENGNYSDGDEDEEEKEKEKDSESESGTKKSSGISKKNNVVHKKRKIEPSTQKEKSLTNGHDENVHKRKPKKDEKDTKGNSTKKSDKDTNGKGNGGSKNKEKEVATDENSDMKPEYSDVKVRIELMADGEEVNEELGEDEYMVECVVGKKVTKGGKISYLVKWKGWEEIHNSWVRDHDLNAPELILDFEQQQKKRMIE